MGCWDPSRASLRSQALGSWPIFCLPVRRGQPSTAIHGPCLPLSFMSITQ